MNKSFISSTSYSPPRGGLLEGELLRVTTPRPRGRGKGEGLLKGELEGSWSVSSHRRSSVPADVPWYGLYHETYSGFSDPDNRTCRYILSLTLLHQTNPTQGC